MNSNICQRIGPAWKDLAGLPFVFATWINNKPLPEDFIAAFNAANRMGVEHIEQVVVENPYPIFDLYQYYTRYISYELDPGKKRKGLDKFLSLLKVPVSQ